MIFRVRRRVLSWVYYQPRDRKWELIALGMRDGRWQG